MDNMQSLQKAIKFHQAGQLDDAEQWYRKILKIEPSHPDANHNLGALMVHKSQPDLALTLFRIALESNPSSDLFWTSFIDTLIRVGQLDVAESIFHQDRNHGLKGEDFSQLKTILKSEFKTNQTHPTQALVDSVIALYSSGKIFNTINTCDILNTRYPNEALFYNISGACYANLGQLEAAVTCYKQALAIKPDHAEIHCNLGVALKGLGQFDAAIKSYEKALSIRPNYAAPYYNYGIVLAELGQLDGAAERYEKALTINPDYAEAHNNLGLTFHELGQLDAAVKSYEKALIIKPEYPEVYYNLGNTLKEHCQFSAAVKHYDQALAIKPDYVEAQCNLGNVLKDLGETGAAIKCYEQARVIKPDFVDAHSDRLLTFNYSPNYEPDFCLKEARKFGVLCSKKVAACFSDFQCSPIPKQLKIGLVSGDFRRHPVGYFLESLLSALTHQNLELIAYTTCPKFDDLSARIKPFFSEWKALFGLTDEVAAKLIHDDGIHILIDLSGHTAHNRLPVFAFKPAPVQVSWLGYFATTGLVEIDYVIGDPYVTPVHVEDQFSETIFRLPHTRWCFTAPMVTIKTITLPALKNGYITFGCFNNLAKLNDQVIKLWIKILRAIPDACLLLKSKQLNSLSVQEMVTTKFTAYGIESERIILAGDSSYEEYLTAYQQVDIALDPFPFTGGTITLEGLWMGVPVLTLQGNTLVSNQGVGILMNAGLPHWIAHDEDDYLAKAINFSSNLKQLASIRSGLREQVLASPLFDAKQFSVDFKNALWTMWQQWLTDNNSI